MAAMKRVGHKGADLLAPGNTLASFDAALAAGVDMIEFDVLPANAQDPGGSALVLSHDYEHLAQTTPVTLEAIKANPKLKEMALLRLSRLSVQPVAETEFREIVRMGAP